MGPLGPSARSPGVLSGKNTYSPKVILLGLRKSFSMLLFTHLGLKTCSDI